MDINRLMDMNMKQFCFEIFFSLKAVISPSLATAIFVLIIVTIVIISTQQN